MRRWLHELLPACVIATGYIGSLPLRAKLVFVMHMGFELVFQASKVKGCGIMGVPSGRFDG
eukprot:932762-Pelagomonas_calceolata.AAC.1